MSTVRMVDSKDGDPQDAGMDGAMASPAQLAMDVVESRVHERLFGAPIQAHTIGRFEVLGPAGAGGMGVVFVARDPQLDRRVAIKLVGFGPGNSSRSQARLLAEAQTMARLSHPNIVAVHDVGTFEGRVYIAMEFVEGETLERWSTRGERRSVAEILRAFAQAGEALAVAHRSGIVHRDFKPANAMIDRAGRVRVLDFGLAVDDAFVQTAEADAEPASGSSSSLVGGTPLYMAPELRAGGYASFASDQYAYCVSLWRVLYGEHPEITAPQPIPSAPRSNVVPAWLRRVLQRGLAAAPAERWPSMEALLGALDPRGGLARRRRALAITLAAVIGTGGVLGLVSVDRSRREHACAQRGEQLAAVWNDDARTRMAEGFRATGLGYADATLEKLLARLDAHHDKLQRVGTEACIASELRGEGTQGDRARAQWCLDQRALELEAIIEQLVQPDADAVRNAVPSVTELGDAETCLDREALLRLPQPPAERREDIRAVHVLLERAVALERAGKYAEGVRVVREAHAAAEVLAWPPLSAHVELQQAILLEQQGEYAEATASAKSAYLGATESDTWNVAAMAAAELIMLEGVRQSRRDAGLLWAELAVVAQQHAGDPQQLLEALRLARVSHVRDVAGDYAAARADAERALALIESALGPDHPATAIYLSTLGTLALATGDHETGREMLGRAITLQTEVLGAEHPTVALDTFNLGHAHIATGDIAGARVLFQRSLDVLERAVEPNNPNIGAALIGLSTIDIMKGEFELARHELERAEPIILAAHGRESSAYAIVLSSLGNVHYESGAYERARPLFEQSLAIEERTLGPHHINVAISLTSIGNSMIAVGELDDAEPVLKRALAISEDALGADNPNTAMMVRNLAGVYCARGDHGRALPLTERAVAAFEREPGYQQGEAGTHALHAKLLADDDPARALVAAEKAKRGYLEVGDTAEVANVQELVDRLESNARRSR